MMRCKICGKQEIIAKELGVCADCIKQRPEEAKPFVIQAHRKSRRRFGLVEEPPKKGVECKLCVNNCRIPEGERGYCGVRANINGRLINLAGTGKAVAEWYYDALPTNCVASWCCPALGKSYPLKNLAVFYGACTFNCLYCQNWSFKENTLFLTPKISAEELASKVDENTYCICYFGGDPTPQIAHAIKTSKLALDRKSVAICFETNGSMNKHMLKEASELSLESNGIIKFDLKAWNEELHKALTGVTNKQTLENFEYLANRGNSIVASTLLVPGYVDVSEVEKIAEFIASLDESIPYSLLAFYPNFYMRDLPTTSRKHAEECYRAAKKYLKNVRIGNVHLLS